MNPRNHATIVATLSVAGVVLSTLSLCVVFGPPWFVGDETGLTAAEPFRAQNDVRSTLLQDLVGFLALGGAALGATVTLGQVRANREKHATDLYVKALELLASDQRSIRHGGVYALARERHGRKAHEDHTRNKQPHPPRTDVRRTVVFRDRSPP